MNFKYQGITLNSYEEFETKVNEPINKANSVVWCLNDTIWRKNLRKQLSMLKCNAMQIR